MEFKSLHGDTTCNCVSDAKQDIVSLYVRRIKRPNLAPNDLQSHWEKGQRPKPPNLEDCEVICGLKGLSVNIWNDSSRESIIKKYLQIFRITPRHQDGLYVFRFRENAGLVKYTPEHDVHHYDFYKCDSFSEDMLEKVEIISLSDFLKEK